MASTTRFNRRFTTLNSSDSKIRSEFDEFLRDLRAVLVDVEQEFNASVNTKPVSLVDGAYSVTTQDYSVICTSGTFTVTLPSASGIIGRIYVIKNTGSGTITLDPDGSETIDQFNSVNLSQWDAVTIQSDGTNWIII